MRIAFATVGCRLNQFETDALRGKAQADGHLIVPFDALADAYVINTCTITAEADADSRRLARQAVRRNPSALVAVTGCYAQAAPEAAAAIPGVDLVLDNRPSPANQVGMVVAELRTEAGKSPGNWLARKRRASKPPAEAPIATMSRLPILASTRRGYGINRSPWAKVPDANESKFRLRAMFRSR